MTRHINPSTIAGLLFFSAIAFLIAFLFIPVLIKILSGIKLFDPPGKHKIHATTTPTMGGVAIFFAVSLTLLMSLPLQEWIRLRYLFIAIGLMTAIGLRDDVLALTAKQKLFSQFLPVLFLIILGGVILNPVTIAFDALPVPRVLAAIVTIGIFIILTNAYNLIDGLDGLAGALGVLILGFYGLWFFLIGDYSTALIAMTFTGALIGFLAFNWQPARIFMGDTGALMIGLMASYLSVQFINTNYNLPESNIFKFNAPLTAALCVSIVPAFDTSRIIIVRLRKRQSPFKADRNHLHHLFLRLGLSHSRAVLALLGIHVIFIILAIFLKSLPDLVAVPIVIAACIGISLFLKRTEHKVLFPGKSGIST